MFVNDYDNGHEILEDNLGYIQKRFDSSKVMVLYWSISINITSLDIAESVPTKDPDKRILGPKEREKIQPEPCEAVYDFNHGIIILPFTDGEEEIV